MDAGAARAGAGASLPGLAGRGVDLGEGTWSASRSSGAGTRLVMRSSWPWGCVTVILVGGLESVASGSRSVAGRFLLWVRAAVGGGGAVG